MWNEETMLDEFDADQTADRLDRPETPGIDNTSGLDDEQQAALLNAMWKITGAPIIISTHIYVDGELVFVSTPEEERTRKFFHIRDCYVRAHERAADRLIAELVELCQQFGVEPTTSNNDETKTTPFVELVQQVLETSPLELRVHGAQAMAIDRKEGKDPNWGALNKKVQRVRVRLREAHTLHREALSRDRQWKREREVLPDHPAAKEAIIYAIEWRGPVEKYCVVRHAAMLAPDLLIVLQRHQIGAGDLQAAASGFSRHGSTHISP